MKSQCKNAACRYVGLLSPVRQGSRAGWFLPADEAAGPKLPETSGRIGATASPLEGLLFQHHPVKDHFAAFPLCSECSVLEAEDEDEEVMVAERPRTITIALDSGAGNHVAGPQDTEGFVIEPSKASQRGLGFIAASGAKILNLGEARVAMTEPEHGQVIRSTFQVAEVSRPLYSVSKICNEGCEVHFCSTHAWVTKDGVEVAKFTRERGLYVAEMILGNPNDKAPADFGRQGAIA